MIKTDKIGLGITTRNRDYIFTCVENIIKNSSFDKLVIIDDESETPVKIDGVKIFRFETRQGIAKCKHLFLELLDDCDHIFLFDDDCWPITTGWQEEYIRQSISTGNYHFSFIWEHYADNTTAFNKLLNIFESEKEVVLEIEGEEPIVLENFLHDTHVRIINVRKGLTAFAHSCIVRKDAFFNSGIMEHEQKWSACFEDIFALYMHSTKGTKVVGAKFFWRNHDMNMTNTLCQWTQPNSQWRDEVLRQQEQGSYKDELVSADHHEVMESAKVFYNKIINTL